MAKQAKGLAVLLAGGKDKKRRKEDEDYDADKPVSEDYSDEGFPTDDTVAEADTHTPVVEEEEAGAEITEVVMPIPAGLDLSDMEPGDTKEVLTIIRKEDDETMSIVKVEGVDIGASEDVLPTEAPPGEAFPPPPVGGDVRGRAISAGLM